MFAGGLLLVFGNFSITELSKGTDAFKGWDAVYVVNSISSFDLSILLSLPASGSVGQGPPACGRPDEAHHNPEHDQSPNADPGTACGDVNELSPLGAGKGQPGNETFGLFGVWFALPGWETLAGTAAGFTHHTGFISKAA